MVSPLDPCLASLFASSLPNYQCGLEWSICPLCGDFELRILKMCAYSCKKKCVQKVIFSCGLTNMILEQVNVGEQFVKIRCLVRGVQCIQLLIKEYIVQLKGCWGTLGDWQLCERGRYLLHTNDVPIVITVWWSERAVRVVRVLRRVFQWTQVCH